MSSQTFAISKIKEKIFNLFGKGVVVTQQDCKQLKGNFRHCWSQSEQLLGNKSMDYTSVEAIRLTGAKIPNSIASITTFFLLLVIPTLSLETR